MTKNNFIELIPPVDFQFSECLRFLNRSEEEILHQIHNQSVCKAVQINNENLLLHISERDGRIQVSFLLGKPSSSETQKKLIRYIHEWFNLDHDLTPFYKLAEQDPILKNLVDKYRGYRVVGIPNLFEAITWAIIGQQINLTFAYRLKKRLVKKYGEKVDWDGEIYWLFPKPEQIAKLNVSDLRDLQFTNRKAEYIIDIAGLLRDGDLAKRELQKKDYGNLKKALISIRGVGEWTADYVIMRCFNRTNAFPIADVGLHRALGRKLGLDRKATVEEIMKYAKLWRGWESYATFYLWRSSYD